MEEIYSNIRNSAGLASVQKLYEETKKIDDDVTKQDVERFLASKPSYTLHRNMRNKFSRRQFLVRQSGLTLMGDVCYLKMYEDVNTPYLLILRDAYSRYLSVFPLKSLKAEDVIPIIDNFFENSIYQYEKKFLPMKAWNSLTVE